jgi:hypothetical protein
VVASVVTVNDSHGFVGVNLECFDRIYLNAWTAMLARYR